MPFETGRAPLARIIALPLALHFHDICTKVGEHMPAPWPCQNARKLEHAILRGPRPKPGTAGLEHALKTFRGTRDTLHRSDPHKSIADAELDAAEDRGAKLREIEALKPNC